MTNLYGLDTEKEFGPVEVRDVVVRCFADAEACDLSGDMETKATEVEIKKSENMIRKIYQEIGEDYEKPTKENLMALIIKLREYAVKFRNPEMVGKHFREVSGLIEKL